MENAVCKLQYRCAVGETAVYSGRGIVNEIPDVINNVFSDGFICVLYDANLRSVAEMIASVLKRKGYRVLFSGIGDEKQLPEYVRFVLAVGAGKAAACAKKLCSVLNIDFDLFLTAPTSDGLLRVKAPKQVFIDENIMLNCPKRCVAAGWGIILSQHVVNFERYFSNKVLTENDTFDDGKPLLKDLPLDADNLALAIRLLELSHLKKGTDSAEIMAALLYESAKKKNKKPRLPGEYKFICASALSAFYSAYLTSPAIDVMPPIERDAVFDSLFERCDIKRSNIDKSIDFFDCNRYFRISYILSEYRMDLLEKLTGVELHTLQRFWRRIYTDAGYWLKGALSVKDITNALCAASVISDGLLGYLGASGLTANFCAA